VSALIGLKVEEKSQEITLNISKKQTIPNTYQNSELFLVTWPKMHLPSLTPNIVGLLYECVFNGTFAYRIGNISEADFEGILINKN
jgi:hypothetical protein